MLPARLMLDMFTSTAGFVPVSAQRAANSRAQRNGPVRFTAITASHFDLSKRLIAPLSRSFLIKSPSRRMPALLTSTLTGPPSASVASSNSRATSASLETSATIPGTSRARLAS